MSARTPSISVVIPTHNRAGLLSEALDSLRALTEWRAGDELLIVANACDDETVARAQNRSGTFPAPLRVIEEPIANLNVARNTGGAAALGDVLAFLDDDVRVRPGWLQALREVFEDPEVDLATGPVRLSWDLVARPDWLTPRAAKLLTTLDLGPARFSTVETSHFVGANLALRAALWRRLGGFHAGLDRTGKDLLSGGDTEFVGRAWEAGSRGEYHPGAAIEHRVTPYRLELRYLAGVARGRGRERVIIGLLTGAERRAMLFRVGMAQVLRGLWWRFVVAWVRPEARIDGVLVQHRGLGTLKELVAVRRRGVPA